MDKKLFSDVTLVPDDLIPITANKTVLSSASPVSGNYFCLMNIIPDHFFNWEVKTYSDSISASVCRVTLYWVKFSQSQRNKNSGFNPLVSDQMAMMDALKGKHP